MHGKMKNSTELCIFIQCWRAIAYSGAAPEKLKNSLHAVCEAGCFVMLRVSGWPCTGGQGRYCFQTNSWRDVINVNSGICFFGFSSSLLSLGA